LLTADAAMTSVREFLASMYEEHLEETSFLYDQRHSMLRQSETSWLDVHDIEERIEAHIDALVVGGESALEVCRGRATDGEAGEIFAAVAVFCRHMRADLVAETLSHLDYDNAERVRAVTDSLKEELPAAWKVYALRSLAQSHTNTTAILATVIGYRRICADGALAQALEQSANSVAPELLWAVGRTREQEALARCRTFRFSDNYGIRSAALNALLRCHDSHTLRQLEYGAASHCPPLILGLGAARSAVDALVTVLNEPNAGSDALTALALLGDVCVLPALIEALSVPTTSAAAADALYVITGAALFEDTFVVDDVAEEELFENELAEYRTKKKVPKRGDGKPFGKTIRRLSQDGDVWRGWLKSNGSRFIEGRRYRLGAMYSPAVLVDCLASTSYPKLYRDSVADELLVRYGIEVVLESDMPVMKQTEAIRNARSLTASREAMFEPGRWYIAGKLLTNS
jgi:uncharacterized protein (TIGR02270 family)